MAQGVGTPTAVSGGQDVFGGHLFGTVDYKGSSSYVQGGDTIDPHAFGFPNNILTLITSCDQLNKFQTEARPLQSGVQTSWQLVWISLVTATVGGQSQTAGQEAAAGTNLSTFVVRLGALGI